MSSSSRVDPYPNQGQDRIRLTRRPTWTQTAPWGTDSLRRRHTADYYRNPVARPGDVTRVYAHIDVWPNVDVCRWEVFFAALSNDGVQGLLYPWSGWGGTTATVRAAKAAVTRKLGAMVAAYNNGRPPP